MVGNPADRSLKETPTWAVAFICTVMVLLSVAMEHSIHVLGKWFQKRHKKSMSEALEKIKAELMLLGFISLFLTAGQTTISKICIPAKAGRILLPCKKEYAEEEDDRNDQRRLLSFEEGASWHRILAGATIDYCSKYDDRVPLISQSGVHQLHIFIFVLAVNHVIYSVLTMALGQAKMKRWKTWESETATLEYQFSNDPSRFRFTHQTSFVRRHVGLSSTPGIRWIVAFFRQFFGSVTKVDYLTMRHGFINAHLSPNSKFDFHKYIKRSLEDDFKVVVGVSLPLWFMAIFILLLDVNGWYTLITISVMALIVLLVVNMKLEIVITEMAHQIQNRTTVVKGAPIVEPRNEYFWFNRPQWILYLIHIILFENAFQMARFLWTLSTFGPNSCFFENVPLTIANVVIGLALQFLCSYISFPLYALVTQMGSHMKKAIFEEQTAKALKKWREAARGRKKLRDAKLDAPSGYMSGGTTPSHGSSPVHLLHKYKLNSGDVESFPNSLSVYPSDSDISEMEAPTFNNYNDPKTRAPVFSNTNTDAANGDFSFVSLSSE